MHSITRLCAFVIVLASSLHIVSAHGLVTAVNGANGITGTGFGVDPTTPRNGGLPVPFERDTSVIRDNEIQSGKAGVCGRTQVGGNNDVASQMAAASAAGLPSADENGVINLTLHQVNQDGAGPYSCDVSADGTGADFQKAEVLENVPGIASLSLAAAKDFPLKVQMPAGTVCSGGPQGNACLVRCRNPALAGPFGGCAAVTNLANTSNTTAAGTAGAPVPAKAAGAAAPAATTAAATDNGGGKVGQLVGGILDSAGAKQASDIVGGILNSIGIKARGTEKRHLTSRFVGKERTGKWI